jgi:hypothetical protein
MVSYNVEMIRTLFPPTRLALGLVLTGLLGLVSSGCQTVDPLTVLAPVNVVTGWYDDGILEGGKNKLVPSVSLRFHNKAGEPVKSIQVNAIFRRVGEKEMWGEYFGWAIAKEPLAAGAETKDMLLRSTLGYTGTQPRMQMLQNKEFVDAKVEIYLRSGSRVWAKLGEYPIQRQLITH